jgi:EAL domain-containing protein (putative c-di-GMP-specific phosphodiesterase class I)
MPGHVRAYLEHRLNEDEAPVRTFLEELPFLIGRSRPAQLVIYSQRVSKAHAEIGRSDDGEFYLRDLGSRNGTFLNGDEVQQTALRHGDVIHIAHMELRFGEVRRGQLMFESTIGHDRAEQRALILGARHLQDILDQRRVRAVFQAVVDLTTGRICGYEALGRSALDDVSYEPYELFTIAAERGCAADLSRLMRDVALEEAPRFARGGRLYLNVHPAEMHAPNIGAELDRIAALLRHGIRPVLEVHEGAVTDLDAMRAFRSDLHALGLELAYDDFGAGQSRLMELCEVPPDVLKLDMGLIRNIDQSAGRRDLVGALLGVVGGMGIDVLAEGIETAGELDACRTLGCRYAQGYLLGRPAPSSECVSLADG